MSKIAIDLIWKLNNGEMSLGKYSNQHEIVFSPNLTKSFPNKFLVAKPKIVIKRMKKIAATINKIISVKKGFITSGSLIYLAGVKLTREFNHFPTSKTK